MSSQENSTLGWRRAEKEMASKNLVRSQTEDEKWEKLRTKTEAQRIKGKSLVLLQVNCKNIYNKT